MSEYDLIFGGNVEREKISAMLQNLHFGLLEKLKLFLLINHLNKSQTYSYLMTNKTAVMFVGGGSKLSNWIYLFY